jgi:hypothetical protein
MSSQFLYGRRAVPSPTLPIAAPALWLNAGAIAGADGDAIGTWPDSSGNGRNATQATAGAKPTLKTGIVNNQPVVRFDGGDYLDIASIAIDQPLSIFLVAVTRGNSAIPPLTDYFFDRTGAIGRVLVGRNLSGSNGNEYGLHAGTTLSFEDAAIDDAWSVWTHVVSGASSLIRTNGATRASGDAGSNNLSALRFGTDYSVMYGLVGDIAEIIIYASALSDANRQAVERYLGAKYNISVA